MVVKIRSHRRSAIALLLLAVISVFSSCNFANTEEKQGQEAVSFLLPVAEKEKLKCTEENVYQYFCNRKEYADYRGLLEENGWKKYLFDEEAASGHRMYSGIYLKGNAQISITDQSFLEENPYITLAYSSGYSGKARKNAVPIETAKEQIKEYIEKNRETLKLELSADSIGWIRELDFGDAFERMGLQAFTVYGSTKQSPARFFVCGDSVTYAPYAIHEFCTADIDGDGRTELITAAGFGSGIYRVQLFAFQCRDGKIYPAYYRCFIPNDIASYGVRKINDRQVRLVKRKGANGEEQESWELKPEKNGEHFDFSNMTFEYELFEEGWEQMVGKWRQTG